MTQRILKVLSIEKNSIYKILSPAVGICFQLPLNGEFIGPDSKVGTLKVLNTHYHLFLPEKLSGIVIDIPSVDSQFPVAYAQELFSINPQQHLQEESPVTKASLSNSVKDISSNQGCLVNAFTTGIFYTKPSPEADPFVREGQQIEKGKILGLIEVMKTFNHVIFSGTKKSQSGIIKKILVKDSQEVKLDEPLFLIEEIKKTK